MIQLLNKWKKLTWNFHHSLTMSTFLSSSETGSNLMPAVIIAHWNNKDNNKIVYLNHGGFDIMAWLILQVNFMDFVYSLIQQCQHSIIYDEYMLDTLVSWLIRLSDSPVRAFRHTSTLVGKSTVTWCRRSIVVCVIMLFLIWYNFYLYSNSN